LINTLTLSFSISAFVGRHRKGRHMGGLEEGMGSVEAGVAGRSRADY